MNTENVLISALSYLLKYQASGCNMAGERAVLMLEAITDRLDIPPELHELCANTIDSIELRKAQNRAFVTAENGYRLCSGTGIPLYADLSLT